MAPLSIQSPKPETWGVILQVTIPSLLLIPPPFPTLIGMSSDLKPALGFIQHFVFVFVFYGASVSAPHPTLPILYKTPRVIILKEPSRVSKFIWTKHGPHDPS